MGMRRALIANRGEIALQAVRVSRALDMESVAVGSTADADSPYVWTIDHAVCIGQPPAEASCPRAEALEKARRALAGVKVEGAPTTIPLRRLLDRDEFRQELVHTRRVENEFAAEALQ